MAGKDIDLIIKAKDRASSELDKISKALKKNVEDQADLAKGASKTSDALGKLATDASKFQSELAKLQAAGKVAAELDKATDAVNRMEGSLKSNAAELAKMARESDAAAQAAARLKGQLAAEEVALASSKTGLADTRKELARVNDLVRDAEKQQRDYNKAIKDGDKKGRGLPEGVQLPFSAGADIGKLRAQQAQINAEINTYKKSIEGSKAAIKELRPQISAASSLQNQLANETSRASTALKAEKEDLGRARGELDSIRTVSAQAGTALGGVVVSQEAVSAAAQRMAANLAAAKARIEGLSNTKVTSGASTAALSVGGVDVQALTTQRRALLEARREWVAAQADVKALGQQMRQTQQPTEQLGAAFGAAQAKAALSKQAYEAQRQTLANLSGTARSTFREFSQATSQLGSAAASTTAANNQMAASANGAANAQRQLRPAIRNTANAASDAGRQTGFFAQALANVGKDSLQTRSLMQALRGEVLSLTASYIGFQAAISQIAGAINSFRALEAVQNRLGSVYEQNNAKVAAQIQFLQQQADRLGISFGVLADEYGKYAIAAKAANFTTDDTRRIFLSVAEAARVNKLSVEQTSGVFLALTQMISKGKVSAEELRGQLGERLPGAFNIFAQAIGKSTAELDKMMQQGEVLSDRSTMLKFADELSRRFGPQLQASLDSVSTDIGRFENNLFNAQIAMANGFIPALRSALQSFNAFAQSTEGQETFRNIGVAVGNVIQILAELPKYFDLITLGAKTFAAVKIAEVFTGMIGRVVQSTSALGVFSRELQLVGPRTQAAAAAQGIFSRGLAQTVSTLGVFRQNLLASTSQTAVARVGVLSLATSVGVLQKALILGAGAFRALLAAFGGPIGIAITGITLAVGSWITSVDSATTSLDEHKRQLDIVKASYDSAKDKVGAWAKEINNVTLSQAQGNLQNLTDTFDSALNDLISKGRNLKTIYAQMQGVGGEGMRSAVSAADFNRMGQVVDLLDKVQSKTISLNDFRVALDEINRATENSGLKDLTLTLQDAIDAAKDGAPSILDLEKAVTEAEAKIRFMSNTATEADKALLGMNDQAKETVQNLDYNGKATEFNKILNTMRENIPGVADELKKLETINGLEKQYRDALKLATTIGQVVEATKTYGDAIAGVNQSFSQKQFDSLPDTRKTLIDRIIYVEGGQNGTGPSTSSARGIGQFTESTWLPIFNELFPALRQLSDSAKLQYRANEAFARPVLEEFTKRNQMRLANAGVSPTDANTYLAHFLGAGDAIKVLVANPDALAKDIVNSASVKANPSVIGAGTTVRDLQNWALQKVGGGSTIMAGGQTKQESFNENLDQRVKGWKEEAAARKESNREGAIAKALAEAENEARKAGVELTNQQRDAIREAVGAKYDSAHADEQLKANQEQARDLLNDIVGLDQQRKNLLQEIQLAQNEGDTGKTAELKTQLEGVNQQLSEAIPKALELARALGDEKMVAQLQKVQLNTAKVGTQFSFLGLNFNQTKQLAVNFADGLVGAFDSFAQSIASGQDAMKALRNAFLQFAADFLRQIATMIMKAIFFRMINSAFPGLGMGVPMAHTGGLVGSAATGGGNGSRQVSPAWFMNPIRYHTGGIAGLRPDEVPTVLKKNEEVLTEQDPRHRFNNTGEKDGGQNSRGQSIKQVLVLDPKDLANALASSRGEQVVVTHIKNNAATIKRMLGN
ncbi:tape measure domain-containing protein [Rhizobium sp. RU20A]|uniref:tape measure protein n=1 Tax=Rhizobium sp. RU20A TaxID=1907412 RepID=UPI00095597DE|nr:tape measure protein [Rhizobium sp. RU20A]SIQ58125.1 tape measure domain-containing protein [Rhizobium sp. RU20A]